MAQRQLVQERFAELLRLAMAKRDVSGRELAARMRVDVVTVSRWRSGTYESGPPRSQTRRALEVELDLPRGYFDDNPEAFRVFTEGSGSSGGGANVRLDTEGMPNHIGSDTGSAGLDVPHIQETAAVFEKAVAKVLQELMAQGELQRNREQKRKALRALKHLARELRDLGADVSDLWAAIDIVESTWPDI